MRMAANIDKLERQIARLKKGDMGAFDYIYECTSRSVYFAALYILGDKHAAEDITQDAYMRAIAVVDQYRPNTNFIAWLCSIARSLALNRLKKYRRETLTDFETEAYRFGSKETEIPYIFDVAAKILSEDEYEIVMMCQVAGYKRREVAELLGMPIGTVTYKNNAALAKLKNHLEKEVR